MAKKQAVKKKSATKKPAVKRKVALGLPKKKRSGTKRAQPEPFKKV